MLKIMKMKIIYNFDENNKKNEETIMKQLFY